MDRIAKALAHVSGRFIALSSIVFLAFGFETFFPNASDKLDAKFSAAWMILVAWLKTM